MDMARYWIRLAVSGDPEGSPVRVVPIGEAITVDRVLDWDRWGTSRGGGGFRGRAAYMGAAPPLLLAPILLPRRGEVRGGLISDQDASKIVKPFVSVPGG